MSESEDEGAFTSADEEVEEASPPIGKDKRPAAKPAAVKDNKKSEEKEKTSNNNMNKNKQKKKNKRSKSKEEEEECAEKLSFESSDSITSTETSSTVQIDNMHSSKPDLEEIRITDESDDSNRTSRNNLFYEDNSSKESNDDERKTDATSLKKEEVKQSQDTCPDPQVCDEKYDKAPPQQSGWGWAKWGSSIIGAAASSVTTFTTQLGDGVNTIIDTVESGLSVVPTPEELAHEAKETENLQLQQDKDSANVPTEFADDEIETGEMMTDSANPGGWWSGWGVSKLTGAVQEKSKHLMTGSLDVLESIGRKTFDAINDHDRAALREKTKMLFERGESPQLTDLLKEAKEKTEIKEKIAKENEEALKSDFMALFEEFQGEAHMDALQLLSQQSEAKLGLILETLSPDSEQEKKVRSQLLALKDAFEVTIEDEDDLDKDHLFARLVTDHLSEVHLGTQPDKLNMCQASARKWIAQFIETHSSEQETEETKETSAKNVYTTAIQSMAELTSKIIEQFHKSGELLLLQKDLDKNMEDRAKSLASLTKIFWTEINILSTKFAKCLNIVGEDDDKTVNKYITNVYLEASNSSSYIDDGFRSLLPIMQLALLEKNFKE